MAGSTEREAFMWMFGLLCTGTCSSLLMQIFTTHGIQASAQMFVWVQYCSVYLVGLARKKPRATPITTRQTMFTTAIGVCHVSGFLVVTAAIEKIGVALYQIIYSSGLVLTALIALVVLRKMPSSQQWLGIGVCTAGLVQRGYVMVSLGGAIKEGSTAQDTMIGVGLGFFVTLCFCMVPLLAEIVNKGQPDQKKLTSADIGAGVARVGVCTMTVYMCVHTIPNWNNLVAAPLAESGVPLWEVAAAYAANAGLYLLHNTFYLETTRTAGATGNGLVNAVRSATVVLAGWAMFCGPSKPHLCLDTDKYITVGLLVLGGVIYTTSPPAYYLNDVKKDKKEK